MGYEREMNGLKKRRFHVLEERYEPHPIYRLWERARSVSIGRQQLPIVVVSGHERYGRLVVVQEADLEAIAGKSLEQLIGQ